MATSLVLTIIALGITTTAAWILYKKTEQCKAREAYTEFDGEKDE